jgi:hypothetical protein
MALTYCIVLTHPAVADAFALGAVAAIESWYGYDVMMPTDLR